MIPQNLKKREKPLKFSASQTDRPMALPPIQTITCFLRTLAFALVVVCGLLPLEKLVGQLLSQRTPRQGITVSDGPAEHATTKERGLIREILEAELRLELEPGQSKIIRTNYNVVRSAVSHPDVVDINAFDTREIEIIGKSIGQATVTFWFEVPNGGVHVLRYHTEVDNVKQREREKVARYHNLQSQINELFPNSQVFLIPIDDKVIVKGQARDSKEAFEIMRLLNGAGRNNQFSNGGFNGRGTASAFGNSFRNSQQRFNGFGFGLDQNASSDNGPNLDGTDNAPDEPNNYAIPGTQFINMLKVPGEHQVMLKVRIAELVRNSSRSLGVDISSVFDGNQLSSAISGGGNLTAILSEGDVQFLIRAIAGHGYGKILAEPTLVTISGKPARFLAGGEFAVPTTVGIGGVGAASTTFRGFGTELQFTPTVVDKDLVRLEVSPSFSTLNPDATVGGIPGLSRRSVDTTVDLREGQWLAIAGLIQDEQGGQRTRVPFLGGMPVLGSLFGDQDTSRQETELVVLVSPELVHPMEAHELPMMLPGMEVTDPTDDDFFLRHQTEGYSGFEHRSTVWPEQAAQQGGFRREAILQNLKPKIGRRIQTNQAYILGPSGFSE